MMEPEPPGRGTHAGGSGTPSPTGTNSLLTASLQNVSAGGGAIPPTVSPEEPAGMGAGKVDLRSGTGIFFVNQESVQ